MVGTPDERAAAALKALTYLRIILTPVVMWLVLEGETVPAAALFAVASLTDFFDGRLARRWKQTSNLGTFLDTTADKLLVAGVLISLVDVGLANPWIAFIIIGRELLILGLRGAVTATDGTVVKPSIWGKAKANVQFLAIFLTILHPDIVIGELYLDEWAMLAAAGVTLLSAFEYLVRLVGRLSGARDT